MKKYALGKKVDLVELSDVFRRHAGFSDRAAVKQLVETARHIACLSTEYDIGVESLEGRNRTIDIQMTQEVTRLTDLAQKLKIKEIVLPFGDVKANPVAHRIQFNILSRLSLPVAVNFQTNPYKKDNAIFGQIDKKIATVLDQGIRGVASIDDDLKYKWDYPKLKP